MVYHHKTVLWININNSGYDQEIPQSQTADKPVEEQHNNHETPGRQTKQSNQASGL